MFIFLIIGLLLGGLVVIFALQNMTDITVTFLVWQFHGSLALILVLAAVAGMIIYAFLSMPEAIKKRFAISRLKKDKDILKNEVEDKKIEVENTKLKVEEEKAKLDATNAYLDDLEKNPRI
jgi:uncharacterized integral membrane protein